MKKENETQSTWENLRDDAALQGTAYHEAVYKNAFKDLAENCLKYSNQDLQSIKTSLQEYLKKEKDKPRVFSTWDDWNKSAGFRDTYIQGGGLYDAFKGWEDYKSTIDNSFSSTSTSYYTPKNKKTEEYVNQIDYYKYFWENSVIANASDVQNNWKTSNKECIEIVLNETENTIQIIYKDNSKELIENIDNFEQTTEEVLVKYCNSPITIL